MHLYYVCVNLDVFHICVYSVLIGHSLNVYQSGALLNVEETSKHDTRKQGKNTAVERHGSETTLRKRNHSMLQPSTTNEESLAIHLMRAILFAFMFQ